MIDFIEKTRENFDIIIIDTPPLLSVTDTTELTPLTDGVVLTVKAGSTPRPAIQRGIQHLSEVGARVLGCVLNDVDFEKEKYHYSPYQYYYQYYYGEKEKKRS